MTTTFWNRVAGSLCSLLMAVAIAALAGCGTSDREAISALLDQARRAPSRIVVEEDLAGLPAPVQRYLRKAGVVEARQLRSVRGRGHAELLFNGSWLQLRTEHYLTAAPLSRNWLSAGSLAGVPLSARDSYCDGEGRMSIRLMEDQRFQEAYGPEMDRGQLITVLADFGLMPTAWVSDAVSWEAVDDRTARVALTADGITVRGTAVFDENDEFAELVTETDRFEDVGGKPVLRRWTAQCRERRVIAGLRVCTDGAALWHDESGPREYVRTWLDEVEFDSFELY